MTDHLITPSTSLLSRWETRHFDHSENIDVLLIEAYQAGANMELEECCSIALTALCCGTKHQRRQLVSQIRERRRPKPPNLKLQALTAMLHLQKAAETNMDTIEAVHIICQALEALPND